MIIALKAIFIDFKHMLTYTRLVRILGGSLMVMDIQGLLNSNASLFVEKLKKNEFLSDEECEQRAKTYLRRYNIDDEETLENCVREAMAPYTTTKINSKTVHVPKKVVRWVSEQTIDENQTYWKAYADNLKTYQNFSDEQVQELKRDCLTIVNRLLVPNAPYNRVNTNQLMKKGLVYGNVQSGKTAAFGGVIAQYVSLGCRVVIVLSGVYNNLREQTLARLRRDLAIDNPPTSQMNWSLITNPGDLLPPNCQKIDGVLSNGNSVVFGVFKKQSDVLERLNENFLKLQNDRYLANFPALIIDDECDQASINVGNITEEERSSINNKIIGMFHKFPRFSYIGFTATPYANVLNEMPGPDSLYPSDFITALPEKEDYYGASKIFGIGEEFENYNEEQHTLDIITTYDKDRGMKGTLSEEEKKLLLEAVRYFLLATACKYWRASELGPSASRLRSHSTMMIHSSVRIDDQKKVKNEIERLFADICNEFLTNPRKSRIMFEKVWNEQYLQRKDTNRLAIYSQFSSGTLDKLIEPTFSVLYQLLDSVIQKTKIKIDNGEAEVDERVNYDDDNPAVFIAVGGNTLSRGLTLEGLVVSFFSRSVRTYDTLFQMGRWFGYRKGYEDLPRLWMPNTIRKNFQFLAGIDIDLRESIKRYEFDETPKDVALAIRTNPHMQIVRKMAMQSAEIASINYAGHRPQTIYFSRDKKWLDVNIEAAKSLIEKNNQCEIRKIRNNYLFENISISSLKEFLGNYQFHENSIGLSSELLIKFIEKAEKQEYLKTWNLVIASNTDNESKQISCTLFRSVFDHPLYYLNRSELDDAEIESRVNLKAITSPTDVFIDIPNEYGKMSITEQFKERNRYFEDRGENVPGLIILYPIDKNSKALPKSKTRVDLNLPADIIGVAFVFPNLDRSRGLADKVSITLPAKYYEDDNYEL